MKFEKENLFSKVATILLEDGTVLKGKSFGADKTVFAEIVFNTGMTGYQEILTDPSYAKQAVVMTYPMIGNYGISTNDVESDSIKLSGLIVKEYCEKESNWQSKESLSSYLKREDIIGVSGFDTRMLTKKIRNQGTMNCLITTEELNDSLIKGLNRYSFPEDVVNQVSIVEKKVIEGTGKKIALIDLGVKRSIIDYLKQQDCQITLFPWNVKSNEILNKDYDCVFLSNGPGDPKYVGETIQFSKDIIGKIPILGICLGHQILALALGADTYKLKYGHRGSNHPVIELDTNRVVISAQNHGYAVKRESFTERMKLTHLNVNDNTVEGFSCPELNIYTVQYHPEAGPGPKDATFIFKEWIHNLDKL